MLANKFPTLITRLQMVLNINPTVVFRLQMLLNTGWPQSHAPMLIKKVTVVTFIQIQSSL